MEGKAAVQEVRRLCAVAGCAGVFKICRELRTVIRVGAVFDDAHGAFLGRQPAQVGVALFRHQHIHIVLRVVHMRDHRHNAGDHAAFGNGVRHEDL